MSLQMTMMAMEATAGEWRRRYGVWEEEEEEEERQSVAVAVFRQRRIDN